MVPGDEIANRLGHKWVVLLDEHEVVGHSDRDGARENHGEGEERVHGPLAADVQVNVHSAIMIEDEVANGVSPLDRVGVAVEGIEEPGVLLRDELTRACVCPKLVLANREEYVL